MFTKFKFNTLNISLNELGINITKKNTDEKIVYETMYNIDTNIDIFITGCLTFGNMYWIAKPKISGTNKQKANQSE